MVSPSNKRKVSREKPSTNKEGSKSLNVKISYKPLFNKRFYLDVNNHKGLDNIKKDLNHLGGIVDDFLVKEVNYVITNRFVNISSKGSSSETAQLPSPSSVQSTSCDSPLNWDFTKEDNKKRVCTRAEVLLERACLKKQGTSDILENARLWAIPVWSVSKLLNFLSGLKESPLYKPPRNAPVNSKKILGTEIPTKHKSHKHSVTASKVQKLHEPFIKIESFERNHKPQFKELSKWPTLNLDSPFGTSPFADPKRFKEEKGYSSNHKDIYPERQRVGNLAPTKTKGGFCELCSASYSDLKLHLQSESHLAFTRDKKNYANLDELIHDYDKCIRQMRYSKCMQAGKQFANLKTIVHTQLSKHLVYELGETLYSGPPSTTKGAEGNHVSTAGRLVSSAGGLEPEEDPPAIWLRERELGPPNDSHQFAAAVPAFIGGGKVPPSSAEEQLGLEAANGIADGASVKSGRTLASSSPAAPHHGPHHTATLRVAREKVFPSPRRHSVPPVRADLLLAANMVRLIQEPKTKAAPDPHALRRAARVPPKRGASVEGCCVDAKAKQSQKELRNRRVSCCPSDRSDSELSDDAFKGAPPHPRKPRGTDEEPPGGGAKLNGEAPPVNGVVGKAVKARRVSRANSDDSDAPSWALPKTNGVADPADNDRVDINLLLEISAKDRKRFENKKAKIKRKCADWMLITETEQYYNEKEEILRNKSREDEKDEEEEEEEEEEETESDSSESFAGGRSVRKNASHRNKFAEKEHLEKSCAKKDFVPKKSCSSSSSTSKKKKKEEEPPLLRKGRGRPPRGSRNLDLLSSLEEESIFFVLDGATRKGKGKAIAGKEKDTEKKRKRLSDAERFLRDNREYYQFPETRDRLRRNTSYSAREQHDEMSISEKEEEEPPDADLSSEQHFVSQSICTSGMVSKNKKGKANGRVSAKEAKETNETEKNSAKSSSSSPPPVPVGPDQNDSINETLDALYFSFEGAPVQETWYQTYQRFIDGAESNAFVYPQEGLRFVLPYEMPKEYFKDLQAKKTLLSKRKSELSDLVRKSPRCHASTLALFSNIFPTKKKKSRSSSLVRADEISSDGTNTPVPEALSGKPPLPPPPNTFETEEELLFIGQCMERIMKSALEENLSPLSSSDAGAAVREGRKASASSKRRARGKRGGTAPHRAPERVELPLEAKAFDNPLASEVDAQFLVGLPRYLEEVSIVPEDILCKDSADVLSESCRCECTERTSCDEASSADERTEVSSESLSLCGSETVDSFNSSFSVKVRKSGPPFKKRRKNLTGWPTRKKRRPAAPTPPSAHPAPAAFDEDNSSSLGFEDREVAKPPKVKSRPLLRAKMRRPFAELLEPCSDLNFEDALMHDRRSSPRKRSSVLYMDAWPLRFRHHHK